MGQADALSQSPLFVELTGEGVHHVFELDSEERAFVVGSSRQADLRLDHAGVAAVEFHIERVADVACLVPAYRGRRLRVNGAPATASVPLVARALVAIGPLELQLKVLHHEDEARTTNRSSSAPHPLPADYAATIPTDTSPTAVAMKSFLPEPLANVSTQKMDVQRLPQPLSPQRTEPLAPVRPLPLPLSQLTERLPPVVPPPAPRVEPVAPRAEAAGAGNRALATQETTAFDVAALVPPVAPTEQVHSPQAEGAAVAHDARRVMPANAVSGFQVFLSQLGALTKRRPVLVLGGAALGAVVLALALVGATRVGEPKPTSAVKAPSAEAPPSAKPTVPDTPEVPVPVPASAVQAIVAVPAPPSARTAKGPHDAEVVSAVSHLAAGRLAEASAAYAALASREMGGDVYGKAAELLARRVTASCAGASASCPEVLK